MSEYLKTLNDDFDRLQLPRYDPDLLSRTPLNEIRTTLWRTYTSDEPSQLPVEMPGLATELGQHTVTMLKTAQRNLPSVSRDDCCSDAEPRLIRSLTEGVGHYQAYRSPLILTHNGEVVGVVKGQGETTLYGLVDVPEFSVIKGAFSSFEKRYAISRRPRTAYAHQAPISALGTIAPLRFSIFSIPVEAREKLLTDTRTGSSMGRALLPIKHQDIAKTVTTLLVDAQPLDLSRLPEVTRF